MNLLAQLVVAWTVAAIGGALWAVLMSSARREERVLEARSAAGVERLRRYRGGGQ